VAATSWRASPPSLNFSKQLPLYTRSAEPSPVSSTFSTLNQSLPPPEFVPRLSAREFSAQSHDLSAATKQHQRAKSDVRSPHIGNSPSQLLRSQVKVKVSSRHKPTPPSLKQIQAKMSRTHGLGASVGAVPLPRAEPTTRTASEDSIEILKTPTDEKTRTEARISLQSIPSRRPPTPPSPSMKESRLAPFLRQRTNGRLAGARPVSLGSVATPKVSSVANDVKPMLRINPPSLTIRPSLPRPTATVTPTRASFSFRAATASPTDSRFNLTVSIPPSRSSPLSTSPASPTGSVRSFRSTSTASPTLSVPIITCTPAPVKVVKNGVEHDTDEEEGDVVVFDSEMEDSKDRDEREKRGKEMRDRLMLRRRSE